MLFYTLIHSVFCPAHLPTQRSKGKRAGDARPPLHMCAQRVLPPGPAHGYASKSVPSAGNDHPPSGNGTAETTHLLGTRVSWRRPPISLICSHLLYPPAARLSAGMDELGLSGNPVQSSSLKTSYLY